MTRDQDPYPAERSLQAESAFARSLIVDAGKNALKLFGAGYETTWQANNTPVTPLDLSNNDLIVDRIKSVYPSDRINSEERGIAEGTNGRTWVVDPNDGTQSLGLLDTWTVCMGLTDKEGKPQISYVYSPLRKALFTARVGEPSTLNDEPIKVNSHEEVKGSYIFFGSRLLKADTLTTNGVAYDRLEGQGAKILNARSLAFGCCMVAAGKAAGAYIGVRTPFEAASVALLVEGAGGKVTDLFGNPPGRLDGEINGLIVSNGLIHNALVEAIAA